VTCICVNTSETHCWSLAPSSTNITAPPADAHRRSFGTHRRLPQQSIAIGRNTASRRTHTHTHYFSKNHLIFSHISPGFPRGPLPSRRPTNTQDISSLPFVLHTLTSFSVIVTSADAQKKRLFMHFLQTIVSLSLSLSLSLIQTFYPPLTPHPLFHDKAHHTGEHSKNMSLPIRYICPLQRHSNPMQTAAGVWPLSARNNPTLLGQTVGSCWETTFQSNRF